MHVIHDLRKLCIKKSFFTTRHTCEKTSHLYRLLIFECDLLVAHTGHFVLVIKYEYIESTGRRNLKGMWFLGEIKRAL